jgi:hypothetical protein
LIFIAAPVRIGKIAIELAVIAIKNTNGVVAGKSIMLFRITSVPNIKVGI